MTGKTLLQTLGQDLKFGFRTMRNHVSFSLALVVTIGLGIGANTAMFSTIRAVLLKPLNYREPDRLVLVTDGATPGRAEEIAVGSRSYGETGTYAGGVEDLALSGDGEAEALKGARVSANFLRILGVDPLRGRSFTAQDDQPGATPVAMISAELWRRRFGRNPAILGKTATLAGVPTGIIGVLPAGFQFPMPGVDVWLTRPSEWSVLQPKARPLSPFLSVFGRLKAHVNLEQATAELAVLNGQYATAHPEMLDAKRDAPEVVRTLKEELVSDIRPKLWMLFGVVGFVLLIVCANVGSLLLARATSRAREFAVRSAIGAGRGRIIRQLLAESMLLSCFGGALGVVLAGVSLSTIRNLNFVDLPRAGEIRIDGMVLAFSAALAVITGVVFGLVPALAVSRPDLAAVLRGSGEGAVSSHTRPFAGIGSRGLLVVGQVSLSIVLLIGATLLIESLAHLYRVDPGFQPDRLLTMKIALSPARYDTDQKRAAFYEQVVEHAESLPGVQSAAVTLTLPMGDLWMGTTLDLAGREPRKLNERPIAIFQNITPDFFRTLQIPLRRGRAFTAQDGAGSVPVIIINESVARVFWPEYPSGADPIGQHLLVGNDLQPKEIVGISADIHQTGKDSDPRPGVYLPCLQKPPGSAMLVVRTNGDPLSFANEVRNQVLATDSNQPASEVSTMDDVVDASEGQLRLMMRLLGAFAAVATLLAVIGLYGVISYSVVQRTQEIGIRRALGAQRSNILSLVARQVLLLALTGVLLGVGGAFALTRWMQDMLFQVSATDPATFIGISVLFVLVALTASYIPARRAAKIDPLAALRIG
ncbi:MAG TPA: ABC transporter permease [Candidatus Dormibacteraeota bacterium]|nr:ABC transporter permease [Candidatus Dormibacteraeota bacterium]